jgi:signal transduction histidine kinase/CheY-like chemotaxis protein
MPDDLRRTAEPVFSRVKPAYLPTIEHIMREALTRLAPVHAVYEYEHPTRGLVWVETYGAPTIDKDGSVIWHGIAADITDQKQAEAALIASEEQLRQSQKLESIGILAGGLAHDFNNMLTAINGYSELIIRKLPVDDPIRKQVEEIRKAGERSAELTRQLLAFSRRQILQPTMLDLNGVVTDTSSMLKRLLGEDITITTKLTHDLWKIKADQGQLTQVVMNLMINSRDAMPDGGAITIETANVELDREHSRTHPSSTPGPYIMLRITDTGVGMDDETRQRVFEPFFTTKPVGRGTGLGLSTVYGIVKQSGGNIWVDSEPGKGATFTIYLPQAADEAQRTRADSEQSQPHSGSEKVLLVEDEASVRGLAREILEACGYEVFEASNGHEAFDRFERECVEIDLLITDIVMPGMSGRELSEKVASRCPHIKVLFTSGYTDDAIIRHGIVDQGKNFLQKPFTFDGLARKVRAVLDESGKPARVNGSKGMASKN